MFSIFTRFLINRLTYSDGQEADISSFEKETKNYSRKLDKKVVRFEDKFDKKAHGNLGPYRKQFLGEEKKMRRHKEVSIFIL